jgi:hypothetical protein
VFGTLFFSTAEDRPDTHGSRVHRDSPLDMVGLWQPCSGANAGFGKSRRRDGANALCAWLEATAGRTHVVSTTPQPLFPLLEADTFIATLHSRPNILRFQMTECESYMVMRPTR